MAWWFLGKCLRLCLFFWENVEEGNTLICYVVTIPKHFNLLLRPRYCEVGRLIILGTYLSFPIFLSWHLLKLPELTLILHSWNSVKIIEFLVFLSRNQFSNQMYMFSFHYLIYLELSRKKIIWIRKFPETLSLLI